MHGFLLPDVVLHHHLSFLPTFPVRMSLLQDTQGFHCSEMDGRHGLRNVDTTLQPSILIPPQKRTRRCSLLSFIPSHRFSSCAAHPIVIHILGVWMAVSLIAHLWILPYLTKNAKVLLGGIGDEVKERPKVHLQGVRELFCHAAKSLLGR